MTMTIEERAAQSWDAWGPYKGPWNKFMEWQLREAVAEAVAAKDAELAALRRPVVKVTEEESAEVHRLLWAIGSGDGFSAMAAAIDKLFEPRVASAVAAERESQQKAFVAARSRGDILLSERNNGIALLKEERERHAAELAAANKAADDEWTDKFTDLANQLKDDHAAELATEVEYSRRTCCETQSRLLDVATRIGVAANPEWVKGELERLSNSLKPCMHAAELAKEKKAYDDQAERFRGLQHELLEAKEKHTKELNELKHLHSDAVHKWQQMEKKHTDELSNQRWAMIQEQREADQRWQAELARVEVEHANEISIMENACKLANNLKDSLDMRTSKAAPLLDSDGKKIFGTDGELMTEADPHECPTFPKCECGLTQAHDSPPATNKPLPFVYPMGVCGNPHCQECYPEGHEAPEKAAPRPSVQFCQDICWRVL